MKTKLKAVIHNQNKDFVKEKVETIKREVGKVIVGQEELIEGIIIALLSDGHILLEGYPGLGKTVTVKPLPGYWMQNSKECSLPRSYSR